MGKNFIHLLSAPSHLNQVEMGVMQTDGFPLIPTGDRETLCHKNTRSLVLPSSG